MAAPVRRLALDTFRGGLRQLGEAYGERFALELLIFLRAELKPDARKLAYARRCLPVTERDAPRAMQFLRGMARSSGLPLEEILLISLHEELVHLPHCTAVVATGAATVGNRTYVAQNWDWGIGLYPLAGLLRLNLARGVSMATYQFPGLWACAGVNSHGLALMWTGAGYIPPLPPVTGVPSYLALFEVLLCRDVPDALAWLRRARRAGPFIFLLGDAAGRVAVVEGTPRRLGVDQSADRLCRANHFEMPEIMRAAKQGPILKQGSTGTRARRMRGLLAQGDGRLNLRRVKDLMVDRAGNEPPIHVYPEGPTILENGKMRFGAGFMTLDSLVADCQGRTLHTCRGGAVPGPWQGVAL